MERENGRTGETPKWRTAERVFGSVPLSCHYRPDRRRLERSLVN
jgi:hypothetical protein